MKFGARRVLASLAVIASALASAGCVTTFDVQGHRGARGLAPENTLPAFAKALELGVTTLELDVGVTADGVVVVSHDARLNPGFTRDPEGRWLEAAGPVIRSLTYEQLARYDVGRLNPARPYGRAYPEQVPADGTRIPKLSDVFELVRKSGNGRVRFNIETKLSPLQPDLTLGPEPFARAVIAEIRRAGMASRSSIQSFDWRTLQVVQKEAPEIATVYLTAQQRFLDNVCSGTGAGNRSAQQADCGPSPWTAGFQLRDHGSVPALVRAAGGRTWSPHFRDVDKPLVDAAHALGLRVVVWTVNAPADIARMVGMGVDGIISDRPDLVLGALPKR